MNNTHIKCIQHTFAELSDTDLWPVVLKYKDQLNIFKDYFVVNWVDSSTWPPEVWNHYASTIRTNNHVEGTSFVSNFVWKFCINKYV